MTSLYTDMTFRLHSLLVVEYTLLVESLVENDFYLHFDVMVLHVNTEIYADPD